LVFQFFLLISSKIFRRTHNHILRSPGWETLAWRLKTAEL
jgi:hypothetical protein